MRRLMACLSVGSYLLGPVAACDSPKSAASDASLAGDWLPCVDAACTELNDDGYRFGTDGSATRINGTESLVADAPICIEVEEAVGSYTFDGSNLTLQGLTISATLDDDRLTLRDVPSYSSDGVTTYVTAVFIRLPTVVGSPCPASSPPPQTQP